MEQNNNHHVSLDELLVPRPVGWICAYPPSSSSSSELTQQPLISLVEGYCGASDRPPTLMMASDSISPSVLEGLRVNKVCTLSVATERDIQAAKIMSGFGCDHGPALTFDEVGLKPCDPPSSILDALPIIEYPSASASITKTSNYFKRPPAIASSPVQMHCRLAMEVPLLSSSDSTMILLQIDTYIIHGNVLRTQSTLYPTTKSSIHGNPDVRRITAKIDCLLLRPLASLGYGRFGVVRTIYHMGRPRPREATQKRKLSRSQELINSCKPTTTTTRTTVAAAGEKDNTVSKILDESTCNNIDWESNHMWEIDDLVPASVLPPKYEYTDSSNTKFEEGDGQTISYTYRKDDICPLGYNPMKQCVCPRFIGWISTYCPDEEGSGQPIAHISPYSFCIDVARGSRPMLAFAACPRSDEFDNSDDKKCGSKSEQQQSTNNKKNDSNGWKDAQRDAELTGVFCVNLVSEEMAWAMNASAAPLGKGLSEFQLMKSDSGIQLEHQQKRQEGSTAATNRIIPTPVPAPHIRAPYVAESAIFMECRYVKTVKIPDIHDNDSMYSLIIGEVVNTHVRNDVATTKLTADDGRETWNIDIGKVKPVARLGYGQEYTVVTTEIE